MKLVSTETLNSILGYRVLISGVRGLGLESEGVIYVPKIVVQTDIFGSVTDIIMEYVMVYKTITIRRRPERISYVHLMIMLTSFSSAGTDDVTGLPTFERPQTRLDAHGAHKPDVTQNSLRMNRISEEEKQNCDAKQVRTVIIIRLIRSTRRIVFATVTVVRNKHNSKSNKLY